MNQIKVSILIQYGYSVYRRNTMLKKLRKIHTHSPDMRGAHFINKMITIENKVSENYLPSRLARVENTQIKLPYKMRGITEMVAKA